MGLRKVALVGGALVACATISFAASGIGTKNLRAEELYVQINERNFPDPAFRQIVTEYDKDGDGYLSTSETNAVTSMSVYYSDLTNMTGLEYFEKLRILYMFSNEQLKELDLSACSSLEQVYCGSGNLEKINVKGMKKLKILSCDKNNLTTVDVSTNSALTDLSVAGNKISKLNLTKNTNLLELDISETDITSIDLSKNTALTKFWCRGRMDSSSPKFSSFDFKPFTELKDLVFSCQNITSLDLSNNKKLTRLILQDDKLTQLNLSNNTALKEIVINGNQISSLDVSYCPNLERLECSDNQISSLNISQCPKIYELSCQNNKIPSLDVTLCSPLKTLACGNNKIKKLDVSKNAVLDRLDCSKNQITTLTLGSISGITRLYCSDNKIASLNVTNLTSLEKLECANNQLTKLNLSGNTLLTSLICGENYISSLNTGTLTDLVELDCMGNSLTSLSLAKNAKLKVLVCVGNPIKTLNLNSNPELNVCMSSVCVPEPYTAHGTKYTGLLYQMGYGRYVVVDANTKVVSSNLTPTPTPSPTPKVVAKIDEEHFPDEEFRKYVSSEFDYGRDGNLNINEVENVTSITQYYSKAVSLQGIEYFTSLEYLHWTNGSLASLDVSKNTKLTKLWVFDNNLSKLTFGKNTKLTYVTCFNNQITSLALSGLTSLETLIVGNNKISSLSLSSNTKLKNLYCEDNQLSSLNLKGLNLDLLICYGNAISSLKIYFCPTLVEAYTNGLRFESEESIAYLVNTPTGVNPDKMLAVSPTTKITAKVSKPSNVSAVSASYNSVEVSWNAVSNATGYQVWRGTSATGTFTSLGTVTTTSRISTGLTCGHTYYYKVRAYIEINGTKYFGNFSSVVSAVPQVAAPEAVKAAAASTTSVKVSWNAVSDATGYQVWRGTSSTGTFTALGTVTDTERICTGLTGGSTYYFKVRAYKEVNGTKKYGPYSAVVSGSPVKLSAPSNVKASVSSSTQVTVSWSSVKGATGYEVFRSTSSSGTYSRLGAVTTTSRACPGLTTGKTYYFKVRAYVEIDGVKYYSSYSTVVNATPKA